MQINSRQAWLVVAAVAALALFAGDSLVLRPLTAAWKARTSRLADLRKQVEQGKSLVQRDQIIRSRWEALRRSTLPANRSNAEQMFLKAVDKWAQGSRVNISAVTPQWKRGDTDDFSALQCRVDATGNMASLAKFIYSIEADPLALRLESAEFGARDKDGQVLSLAMQISGLVLGAPAQ